MATTILQEMNCVPLYPLANKVYGKLLHILAVLMSVCLVPKMLTDANTEAKQANATDLWHQNDAGYDSIPSQTVMQDVTWIHSF